MSNDQKPIYITRPALPPLEKLLPSLESIWSSRHVTNFGPFEQKLQGKIEKYLGLDDVLVCSNGHIALETMLSSMREPGEIITTPFTFASTIHAIVNTGNTPVFVDVDPNGLGPDPKMVEQAINDKTRGVLGVHVYGVPCAVKELSKIGAEHDILIMYDAAHAFGAQHEGRSLISFGDAAAVSFHATKIFNSIEGGCVSVNSERIQKDFCIQFRNFGIKGADITSKASNAKMSELHAAVGLLNLEVFEKSMAHRKNIARNYDQAFSASQAFQPLTPSSPNASYYVVKFSGNKETAEKNRAAAILKATEKGVFSRPYFSPSLNKTTAFSKFSGAHACPRSELLAASVLCLPIYDTMTEEEQARVIDAFSES